MLFALEFFLLFAFFFATCEPHRPMPFDGFHFGGCESECCKRFTFALRRISLVGARVLELSHELSRGSALSLKESLRSKHVLHTSTLRVEHALLFCNSFCIFAMKGERAFHGTTIVDGAHEALPRLVQLTRACVSRLRSQRACGLERVRIARHVSEPRRGARSFEGRLYGRTRGIVDIAPRSRESRAGQGVGVQIAVGISSESRAREAESSPGIIE